MICECTWLIFINDDESGLHHDYEVRLEKISTSYTDNHNRAGEVSAHLKRQIMGREVVVAVTNRTPDFGPWEQIFYGEFAGNQRASIGGKQRPPALPSIIGSPAPAANATTAGAATI